MGASPAPGTGPRTAVQTDRQIRERLLRLDHVDRLLRQQWASGGYRDQEIEARIRDLNQHGLAWLRRVVRVHGWPGRSMIGREAAAAASRLLRHAEVDPAFRRECLALIAHAARFGEIPAEVTAPAADVARGAEGEAVRDAGNRAVRGAEGEAVRDAAARRARDRAARRIQRTPPPPDEEAAHRVPQQPSPATEPALRGGTPAPPPNSPARVRGTAPVGRREAPRAAPDRARPGAGETVGRRVALP